MRTDRPTDDEFSTPFAASDRRMAAILGCSEAAFLAAVAVDPSLLDAVMVEIPQGRGRRPVRTWLVSAVLLLWADRQVVQA